MNEIKIKLKLFNIYDNVESEPVFIENGRQFKIAFDNNSNVDVDNNSNVDVDILLKVTPGGLLFYGIKNNISIPSDLVLLNNKFNHD